MQTENPEPLHQLNEAQKKLNDVSSSFCLAKWYQVTLHLFNGNTQSCHHVKSHRVSLSEIEKDPSAIHNSKFKKLVRQDMKSGRFPKECQYCWNLEKLGEYSDRAHKSSSGWAMPYLAEARDRPADENVLPTYLEVAFDNICNFKCAYCSPAYSTSWEAEIRQHGPYPTVMKYNNLTLFQLQRTNRLSSEERAQYLAAFWKWWPETSSRLHHLRVTGGEPLLTAGTWKLLDSLAEDPKPHLMLSVNSNLGAPEALIDKLLQKLAALDGKIKKFTLFCSVDTVGRPAEYIRFGLNYERFQANVRKILSQSPMRIQLSYMITVNALCLPGLKNLMLEIAGLRRKFPQHEISLDTPYLNHPEHLSVRLLTPDFQRYVSEAVEVMRGNGFVASEMQKLERILELMRREPYPRWRKMIFRRDLLRFLQEHDRRRGTDYQATFPEYAEFFKRCAISPIAFKTISFLGQVRGRFARLSG